MKKFLSLSFIFLFVIVCNSQDKPTTVPKLKEFIGFSQSRVESILKNKKYFLSEKDVDESGYNHEYYSDSEMENEIDILFINKITRGAGIETLNIKEYENIIAWLKSNKFYLKTKGDKGIKRQDLWESDDKNWRFVIDYKTWPSFEPLKIMLYKTQ